jgi:protein-S-isoprenylcysteine O-methyltransferase Ste14
METITYILKSVTLEKYRDTINESIVVSFILGVYNFLPYYSNFLDERTKLVLSVLGILYLLYSWSKTYLSGKQKHLKFYLLYDIGSNIVKKYFNNSSVSEMQRQEVIPKTKQNDLLFLFVKLFYIPVMLNFTIVNFDVVVKAIKSYYYIGVTNLSFFNWYSFIIAMFFLIDTSYFLFGYLVESKKLGNTIRSVDKSVLSWLFTLACYPPLNAVTTEFFPWVANENNLMISNYTNYFLLSLIIILFGIYLSATISLGSKCSNLTNRGTVSRGPYKFIRHPAYTTKIIAWWLMTLPVMNLFIFFNMMMWTIIYIVRAIKEEDHLLQDQEYKNYYLKTPYRFIPKII